MSTYNGSKFLLAQLRSILSQDYKNFTIIIRDDGSNDDTWELLQHVKQDITNVYILTDRENLGPSQSFSRLLQFALDNTNCKYFMFSDQDDVWFPNKISDTYRMMKCIEEKLTNKPILIHSDMFVTNEDLEVISTSFWDFQKINPTKTYINQLMMQNVITGCTMMINRALANKACPIPKEAIMHDWWIALIASLFGHIGYIKEPTMFYRQHNSNAIGAKAYNIRYFLRMLTKNNGIKKNIIQCKVLANQFRCSAQEGMKAVIAFSNFDKKNKLIKVATVFRYKLFKNGLIRNIGLIVSILIKK